MNCFKKLRKFLDENEITKIVFLSDNQDSFSVMDPCVLQLYFTDVLINESIRRVCFAGNENRMRIGSVKDIKISDSATANGKLIKIISESRYGWFEKTVYTFVAHMRII